jgi:hypothetical protein
VTIRSNLSACAVVLVAALVALGACGDDEPDDAAPEPRRVVTSIESPVGDEPAVAAYEAWLAALEDHDAAGACARQAPDFTIELRLRAILLHRAELGDACTLFVAVLWEDPAREYDAMAIEPTQVTEEDAVLAVDFAGVDETVTMAYRQAGWYVADTSPRTSGAVDSAGWVSHWCDLAVGMDRDEVVERMGEASGEYTVANGGEPQLWWADRQYDFRAYLDPAGRVLDLVGDYDRLSAEDRAALTCPELR